MATTWARYHCGYAVLVQIFVTNGIYQIPLPNGQASCVVAPKATQVNT
jgi:hypothetical protein